MSLQYPAAATSNPLSVDAEAALHQSLASVNRRRFAPMALATAGFEIENEYRAKTIEAELVETARAAVRDRAAEAPREPSAFIHWFERLEQDGPGQGDPLFPWLREGASLSDFRWFLANEIAGEAGFDDLLAYVQVRMPERVKLELARNYWDEMGRGNAKGMHGPMLGRLAEHLQVRRQIETTVWPALALANTMIALATNRRYAYQALGALGAIELTAPGRSTYVAAGLRRLGVPTKARHYFELHAILDREHSKAWNREVLFPLVEMDSRLARPLAEGALMRLQCGAQCFEAYRAHFLLAGRSGRR
jgi:hypothetical protein